MKGINGKYLMVLIAMCGTIASSIGTIINVSGVFITPVAAEFAVGKGSISLTMTISNLVFAIGGMATTRILDHLSYRRTITIFTAIFAGTTVLLALSPNLAVMYLLCALRGFAGGAVGMVFSTLILNNWFIKSNALMTSIAFGCSGIAGAILSPAASAVISRAGWRAGYLFLAVVTVLLNLPAILMPIADTPEQVGMKPYGLQDDTRASSAGTGDASAVSAVLLLQVIVFAAGASFITALPQHFPGIAENAGLPAAGSVMLSIAMVINTAGKFLIGILISRLGVLRSLLSYFALVMCGIAVMLVGSGTGPLLAGAAMVGLSYSLNTVGSATVTRAVFGSANYGKIYPKVSLCVTVANAIAASVIGYIYDFTVSYQMVFCLLLGVAIIASVTLIILSRHRQPEAAAV